jgi:hypothetical protein
MQRRSDRECGQEIAAVISRSVHLIMAADIEEMDSVVI